MVLPHVRLHCGLEYNQRLLAKVVSETSFSQFGGLAADIGKSCVRDVTFIILVGWPEIWQKGFQRCHFQHFGRLAENMSKSRLRDFIFRILVGWSRI